MWLEAGNQDFVLLKADVIYSSDNLVAGVETRLEEELGLDAGAMKGYVALTTSHTHNAPANFSDQIHFYLGGDRYNEEVVSTLQSRWLKWLWRLMASEKKPHWDSLHTDWDPDDQCIETVDQKMTKSLFGTTSSGMEKIPTCG